MKLRPEILLHPNIPKPLHGLAPRVIKGQAWWDAVRRESYAKGEFRCWACGVHKAEAKFHKWLEAHELYAYDYPAGRITFIEAVALCHACHNFIHSGRLAALTAKGEITQERAAIILAHGEAVLRNAGLVRPERPRVVAPWGAWRMVLDGVAYGPRHASFADWFAFYNGCPPETLDSVSPA